MTAKMYAWVLTGILVFLSGCLPVERQDMNYGAEDTEEQKKQVKEEPAVKTVSVKVYFLEVIDDTERLVEVKRKTELVNGREKSAINALLQGVTEAEKRRGCTSAVPADAELLSFSLENGIVTADFSADIEPGGGSAWVTAIRDQITATLMEFDSVSRVDILVEGQSEDVLQP